MKIAIIGVTGLVGEKMLEILGASGIAVDQLISVASEKSVGKSVQFRGAEHRIISMEEAIALAPDVALFSAGGSVSLEYAPRFAAQGTVVIDNSSAWRMQDGIPLIVPEVNAHILRPEDKIIANPNCSTIQLMLVLKPLQEAFGLKRVVVSTYQSVTGTGVKAVAQMDAERAGQVPAEMAYKYQIDRNCLPQVDVFLESGYTKEEMKVIEESRKILSLPDLQITCTAVRVPVTGGHSESVNIELARPFELNDVRRVLSDFPGIILTDDPQNQLYPMPIHAHNRDEVFVGRIRRDESLANTLNLWIVADNLRKGAATNAVQILEYVIENVMHRR